eukprot:11849172-Karenia_brevis.AAC.1
MDARSSEACANFRQSFNADGSHARCPWVAAAMATRSCLGARCTTRLKVDSFACIKMTLGAINLCSRSITSLGQVGPSFVRVL